MESTRNISRKVQEIRRLLPTYYDEIKQVRPNIYKNIPLKKFIPSPLLRAKKYSRGNSTRIESFQLKCYTDS